MRKVLAGIAAASVATALAVTVMSCAPTKPEEAKNPFAFAAVDLMYTDTLKFLGLGGALPMFASIADSVDKIVITNDNIVLTTNDGTSTSRPLSGSYGPFSIAITKKKVQ